MVSIQYWKTVSETRVLNVSPQYSDTSRGCVSLDPRVEPVINLLEVNTAGCIMTTYESSYLYLTGKH